MDDTICAICGGAHERGHHLTGRGADGDYLDPDLVAPLCHSDHELVHEDLRQAGVDKPVGAVSIFEQVAYRLERVGVFVGRVAEVAPFAWLTSLAAAVHTWSAQLYSAAAALDAWNPAWRLLGGLT